MGFFFSFVCVLSVLVFFILFLCCCFLFCVCVLSALMFLGAFFCVFFGISAKDTFFCFLLFCF